MINSERRENIILWEQDSARIFFLNPRPPSRFNLSSSGVYLRGFGDVGL